MSSRAPLYAWEKGLEEQIHLIGLMAIRWTQVEIVTLQIITAMADIKSPAIGVAVTTHIGDKTAMDIIRSLSNAYEATNKPLFTLFRNFTSAQDILRTNRNFIIHGNHTISEFDSTKHIISRMSSRGQIRIENFIISVDNIVEQIRDIQALVICGKSLVRALNNSRLQKLVVTKVHRPPQPKLLTSILPKIQPEDFLIDPQKDDGWQTMPPQD